MQAKHCIHKYSRQALQPFTRLATPTWLIIEYIKYILSCYSYFELYFTGRKMDDNPVDEELRASIRSFCESLVSALNKYYAFGSCFTDDYT